ncbi:hypothetical protein E0765_07215 [Sulfuricurvum sp. IAE1]|uniref:hypothetical protein n=1 Tax=Sulfuricurvum sp. IAE1 TaxID=2546102 RepID=UPI001050733C|nr:hypothetical protein [Sulfuricurvum sp. IAE1]TDA63617.1 hypothetical protein E0765_07215 [Sulfuricurvum sp. IAE1]
MGKLYFFIILAIGGYFYMNPGLFDTLRGEASAQVVQTVDTVQAEATKSVIEAVGGPDGGAGQ